MMLGACLSHGLLSHALRDRTLAAGILAAAAVGIGSAAAVARVGVPWVRGVRGSGSVEQEAGEKQEAGDKQLGKEGQGPSVAEGGVAAAEEEAASVEEEDDDAAYFEVLQSASNRLLLLQLREAESGDELWVANYHMPCRYQNPRAMVTFAALAAQRVQTIADGEPYILAGDFNFVPSSSV